MNILGLTGQHKIVWKSGRKFILKCSPQADFNFVQPWLAPRSFVTDILSISCETILMLVALIVDMSKLVQVMAWTQRAP